MYCSEDCLEKDSVHESLHYSVNDDTLPPELLPLANIALNSVRVAGGVDELVDLLHEAPSKTVFDFDLSNPDDPAYEKNLLIAINSLAKAPNDDEFEMITEYAMTVCDEEPRTGKEKEVLRKILSNHARLAHLNLYSIFDPKSSSYIGKALFPFMSLFNHSCDANVARFSIDDKMALIVARPIKAGEQIFITYGPYFNDKPREDRREYLKRKFSFECDCTACFNDYPKEQNDPDIAPPPTVFNTLEDAIAQFKKN